MLIYVVYKLVGGGRVRSSVAREAIGAETVDFLLSAAGRAALEQLQSRDLHEQQSLALLTELRRTWRAAEAGALLALARLRQRAATKFPQAEQLFFTAEALEQATAWPIAQHRAAWIDQHAPPGPILDLGCGVGGDLLALAQRRSVVAIDLDPIRLRLAAANVAALGLTDRVQLIAADWTQLLARGTLPPAAAAFADPARRAGNQRLFHLHQLQPPLSAWLALQQKIGAVGVKVMPGVADEELPPACGVEFISHEGICKEGVLWFGPLAQGARWASVHTAGGWLTVAMDTQAPPLGALPVPGYLHEPDGAVIRAHGFGALCTQLGAHLFDDQIAYLVSTQRQTHPLVQSFQIDEVHPFSLKLLNARLQARGIGQVELKKRGFPLAPEELRPRLQLVAGGKAGVVIFTRRGNERLMLIGERLPPA